MLQRGQITQNTCNYLTTDIDRSQQFYLLPKIHKDPLNPPGRPIVSGIGGPTEKNSQLVDHFIGPLVPLSQSYIRDPTHLIHLMSSLCNLGCYCAPWILQAYTLTYLTMKVSNPLSRCWLFTNHLTVYHRIITLLNF